jgi:hypothetical protein
MPLPNQFAHSVLYYQSDSGRKMEMICWHIPAGPVAGIDPIYATAFANAVDCTIGVQLKTGLGIVDQYLGVKIDIHDSGVVYTGTSTASRGSGLVAGDDLPDFCCAVLRKFAGVPGRPGMGRWRIGCVPEAMTDDNQLTGPGRTQYLLLGGIAMGGMAVGGDTWNGAHRSVTNDTLIQIVQRDVDINIGRISKRQSTYPL